MRRGERQNHLSRRALRWQTTAASRAAGVGHLVDAAIGPGRNTGATSIVDDGHEDEHETASGAAELPASASVSDPIRNSNNSYLSINKYAYDINVIVLAIGGNHARGLVGAAVLCNPVARQCVPAHSNL